MNIVRKLAVAVAVVAWGVFSFWITGVLALGYNVTNILFFGREMDIVLLFSVPFIVVGIAGLVLWLFSSSNQQIDAEEDRWWWSIK